jgi:hypothetical protein
MMRSKALAKVLVTLVVAAGLSTPAYANYFHDSNSNTNLNIGSTPNPTPDDIRAAEGRQSRGPIDLKALLGKPVYGADGIFVGVVSDVDSERDLAAVRIAQNDAVALPGKSLIDDGRRVFAPNVTKAQVQSMPRIPQSELGR